MKHVNSIALILSLILICAAVLFVFGNDSKNSKPSTVNTRGLGLAAYAELLRRENLPFDSNRSTVLDLNPKDVLVVVDYPAEESFWSEETVPTDGEETEATPPPPSQFDESVTRHLKAGGRVLRLYMPSDNEDLRPDLKPVTLKTVDNKESFSVDFGGEPADLYDPTDNDITPVVNFGKDDSVAVLYTEDGGVVLEVADSTFLRNRFIGQADNAKLGVWIARRFLPPGGKLVFAEASAGNQEARTALDEIGKWATTAFWQLMLAAGLVIFTLNRRFGVPSREITPQRGAKELMGAMSLTMQRAKRRDHALLILRAAALDRVRKALRLSIGMSENEIIARMHPDAQAVMAQILRIQGHEINLKSAISAAHTLESHVRELELEQKASRAPQ